MLAPVQRYGRLGQRLLDPKGLIVPVTESGDHETATPNLLGLHKRK